MYILVVGYVVWIHIQSIVALVPIILVVVVLHTSDLGLLSTLHVGFL